VFFFGLWTCIYLLLVGGFFTRREVWDCRALGLVTRPAFVGILNGFERSTRSAVCSDARFSSVKVHCGVQGGRVGGREDPGTSRPCATASVAKRSPKDLLDVRSNCPRSLVPGILDSDLKFSRVKIQSYFILFYISFFFLNARLVDIECVLPRKNIFNFACIL
jgi:hypothetical protein